tara:strand:- start:1417 stop:1746 length:330 start_codon:yes stop_codon:yes gene_type:complete
MDKECIGNKLIGTTFKPSETTPDKYGYTITEYDEPNKVYICVNIASHHQGMSGTQIPCTFVDSVLNEKWQIKPIKKKKAPKKKASKKKVSTKKVSKKASTKKKVSKKKK